MCDRCEWKEFGEQVRLAIKEGDGKLKEHQREWLERIDITVDDDRHVTDRQKAVVKRIMKEAKIERWRKVPKIMDRKKWGDRKKELMKKRRKESRDYRRYGGF